MTTKGTFVYQRDSQLPDSTNVCSLLKELLQQAGLQTDQYNTHSFRIGAATTAKSVGISDYHIKVHGR